MAKVYDESEVACHAHLVEKGILKPDSTIADANERWEETLDEDCEACSVHEDCSVYLENVE